MSGHYATISLAESALVSVLCFIGSIVFLIYGNYSTSFWFLVACLFIVHNTCLEAAKFANKLDVWYSPENLADVRDFGFCFSVVILGFFSFAIFQVFYYHCSIHDPISTTKVTVAVSRFLAAHCAFRNFLTGRKYLKSHYETMAQDRA